MLQQDLDGDGVIAANGEQLTWRLAGTVLRRDAGGGAQPIVNGVRALELRYFDAGGAVGAAPADVRSIAITLTLEPPHDARVPAATTLAPLVRLRNR